VEATRLVEDTTRQVQALTARLRAEDERRAKLRASALAVALHAREIARAEWIGPADREMLRQIGAALYHVRECLPEAAAANAFALGHSLVLDADARILYVLAADLCGALTAAVIPDAWPGVVTL
jgi:hypothetical protein